MAPTPKKHKSSHKTVCDGLQELAQKRIDKVKSREGNLSELHDLKIKKAKLDVQASEVGNIRNFKY